MGDFPSVQYGLLPISYTYFSGVTVDENKWVLGIDEAGRGPVLGPLAVGMCLCRERDYVSRFCKMGFKGKVD